MGEEIRRTEEPVVLQGIDATKATTLNAQHTSPVVIKAIYQTVENMGFRTGNILGPSCGIGNFFGLVPESMKDGRLYTNLIILHERIHRLIHATQKILFQQLCRPYS